MCLEYCFLRHFADTLNNLCNLSEWKFPFSSSGNFIGSTNTERALLSAALQPSWYVFVSKVASTTVF